jgi:hypothetical protein
MVIAEKYAVGFNTTSRTRSEYCVPSQPAPASRHRPHQRTNHSMLFEVETP